MSDCAENRFNEKEDFQVVLSKGNSGESSHQKHSMWMAHWTRASSNAEHKDGKSCSPLEDANNGTCTKDPETSSFELMKASVSEGPMVGGNHERTSLEHVQQLNSNMWSVANDACQEAEQKKIDQRDGSFQTFMMQMQKHENLYAKTVVPETFSICGLSEFSLDFQKLVNPDNNLNSQWSQFPMPAINKRFDSILNPKGSATDTMSGDLFVPQQTLKLNMAPSNLLEFSSQGYELRPHRITHRIMNQCKPAEDIMSPLEDPTSLYSNRAEENLNCQLPIKLPCSYSKVDNNLFSGCLIDEQRTDHYFANQNQEPPRRSSVKKFNLSENNYKGQSVGGASQSQKAKAFAEFHKEQDSAGVVFSAPVLGEEYKTEPITYSKNSNQYDEKCYGSYISHGRVVASPLLSHKHHFLDIHRMEPAANVADSPMLPDPTHERQPVDKFTDSSRQRGPCLFEMLTVPSKSQSAYRKDSLSSGKFSGFGVCMYGTSIGSRLSGAQNQFSAKTEALHSDTKYDLKSSAGFASWLAQKDNDCTKLAKSEQPATLSMKESLGYNKENRYCNVNEHQDTSFKTTNASKQELCIPGTEIMGLDPVLFQLSIMRNQVPGDAIQSPARTEPSDRWLKRLRPDIADPDVPDSKRSKVGDSREPNRGYVIAPRRGRSDIDMVDRTKQNQELDEGIKLQDIQEIPPVSTKSVHCWLGRWCKSGTPVSHEDPDLRKYAAKPDLASKELEGQFPSISAMAMMGRAMGKAQSFDHQRKGPFVMWKT